MNFYVILKLLESSFTENTFWNQSHLEASGETPIYTLFYAFKNWVRIWKYFYIPK